MAIAPVISDFDPLEHGEGSIDPLGLAPAYERLADRMLQNVTVRMGRIRFVTAIAIGTWICQGWDSGERAADGISLPWQVFEWAVVMAFVKAQPGNGDEVRRIAGSQKVQRALRAGFAISAKTYLKTPTVFGFGGVFKRFAVGTEVIGTDGRLDDAGHTLVRAWAQDQGLMGFVEGPLGGPGRVMFDRLQHLTEKGMRQGSLLSADVPDDLAQELASRLDPGAIGVARERDALKLLVERRAGPLPCAPFLSAELEQRRKLLLPDEEPAFMRPLVGRAPTELRDILTDIDAYESLCRPLVDTFDWVRYWATQKRGVPLSRDEFVAAEGSGALLAAINAGVERVMTHTGLLERDATVRRLVDQFHDICDTAALFDRIIEFHEEVQRAKPPEGKLSWMERDARGVAIRPGYTVRDPPVSVSTYTHEYRLPTVSRFLLDLGLMQ